MKKWLPFVFLLLAVLGCNLPQVSFLPTAQPTPAGSVRPTFVNYPAPATQMDLKPFQDAGCKADAAGKLRCPPGLPPFDKLGCYDIGLVSPYLAGLKPGAALMGCMLEPQPGTKVAADTYLYQQGCLAPTYMRLVLAAGGQIQLIKNLADLKKAAAPLDTPEKALAYAMAATGFQALFGLKDENLRYRVARIEDSHVTPTQGGYDVTLYSFATCGCGPHAMSRRIVHLNTAGDFNSDDPYPVWEDPAQDGICVD